MDQSEQSELLLVTRTNLQPSENYIRVEDDGSLSDYLSSVKYSELLKESPSLKFLVLMYLSYLPFECDLCMSLSVQSSMYFCFF